jgi:3,4-dihydroxy-2-butanone 4-phosphate synthase
MENVRTNKLRRNGHVEESAGIRELAGFTPPYVFKFLMQSMVTRITIKCITHNVEAILNQ